jgi:hypothetical protein
MKLLKQSSMFHACHDEALRKVVFIPLLNLSQTSQGCANKKGPQQIIAIRKSANVMIPLCSSSSF